jgi:hypothetical protein
MIEAMKQALEALEIGLEYAESELYENRRRYEGYMHLAPDDQAYVNQIKEAITSLRQAIEQAEKNDLERLRDENERLHIENRRLIDRIEVMGVPVGVGGYLTTTTTPQPQREWVGLTEEEIDKTHETQVWDARRSYARAIEAKLKQKNGCAEEKNT